jgi:hypothetical protein
MKTSSLTVANRFEGEGIVGPDRPVFLDEKQLVIGCSGLTEEFYCELRVKKETN